MLPCWPTVFSVFFCYQSSLHQKIQFLQLCFKWLQPIAEKNWLVEVLFSKTMKDIPVIKFQHLFMFNVGALAGSRCDIRTWRVPLFISQLFLLWLMVIFFKNMYGHLMLLPWWCNYRYHKVMFGCREIMFMLLEIQGILELCLMVSLQGRSFVG